MPKRKLQAAAEAPDPSRRRSARLQRSAAATNAPIEEANGHASEDAAHKRQPRSDSERAAKKSRPHRQQAIAKKTPPPNNGNEKVRSSDEAASSTANGDAPSEGEKTYWLMKAEPDSRFENGVDVKFSIDDLAARTEPEPWDGIRAYAARNNLRAMKKGDLAFFYHSNCKDPGIVGTMEIVQEHSPDLSAHDPKAPYYDPKSSPSDPKWSVVHVEFRSKFAVPIRLKELREMGGPGKPLESMQMLKQSRLSVSKVTAAEWEYLMGVAESRATSK